MIAHNGSTDAQIEGALLASIDIVKNGKQQNETRQQGGNPTTALAPVLTRAETQRQQNQITPFKRAVKYEAKGRIALVGPAGSGKSLTMLIFADALGKKIAAVDTEHGSLSKYADLFAFDVMEPSSYSVESLIQLIDAAEKSGYEVFCIDSLSHYWMGADGALEFVDKASKRQNAKDDSFAGWKAFRPQERRLVDRIIASPMHIIVTMRVKTEYAEAEVNGKKKRVKIGLKPVQTEGLEYEFDLVGAMDEDNTLVIDKTRCPEMRQGVYPLPTTETADTFRRWLKGAKQEERKIELPPPAETPIDTGGHPCGTQAAQDYVRDVKLAAARQTEPIPSQAELPRPWTTLAGMYLCFEQLKAKIPEAAYNRILRDYGVDHPSKFQSVPKAVACYRAMAQFVADKAVQQ